jgi:hypothetical protein
MSWHRATSLRLWSAVLVALSVSDIWRQDSAAIVGRAMHGDTPVIRAVVTLSGSEGDSDRQTVTDTDGRFTFERLRPGRYLLTASKAGWATSYYGSIRPGRGPGVRVVAADGSRMTVDIPMVRGAVIAGRILDGHGLPAARLSLALLERRSVGGRSLLSRVQPLSVGFSDRSTNDRGEFRLFGLPPGTYYLVAMTAPRLSGARMVTEDEVRWAQQHETPTPPPPLGPLVGHVPVYYPGTIEPAAAVPIVVAPGENREDIVFRMGFLQVAQVSGVVRRVDGSPASGAALVLAPLGTTVGVDRSEWRATADKQGAFVIRNVPAGLYRVSSRAAAVPVPHGEFADFWGATDVAVGGTDVEGLMLALGPSSNVSGRLIFDGTHPPPPDLGRIRLELIGTEAALAKIAGLSRTGVTTVADVTAEGTFQVRGLAPDRYVVLASGPGMRQSDGRGWWLTSVHARGQELGDKPLEIGPAEDVPDVTIVFGDRVGILEGQLLTPQSQPASEYVVLAFPVDRAEWTPYSRRFAPPVRPGTDGRFRVALLPGEYYLSVITDLDQDEATDSNLLEALLPHAIRVTLTAGGVVQRTLRIAR